MASAYLRSPAVKSTTENSLETSSRNSLRCGRFCTLTWVSAAYVEELAEPHLDGQLEVFEGLDGGAGVDERLVDVEHQDGQAWLHQGLYVDGLGSDVFLARDGEVFFVSEGLEHLED